MSSFRITAVVIATIALVLAGDGDSQAAPKPRVIQVVAGSAQNEFVFSPKEITALAGQPIIVTVINKGKIEHDFHIEALGVKLHSLIPPGKSASLEFTPTKKGSFEFFCLVPGHKEVGMKGVVIVK